MKHLGISGGGTKIAGLFGVCESIIKERGYKPDIISRISAGALLSVPLALGKLEEIKKLVLNLKFDTFFNDSSVKNNGKIRAFNAIKKIIMGKHYLGKQKNLEKTLSELVSKDEFEDYKNDTSLPFVWLVRLIVVQNFFYINLKNVSYENFLKYVNASASLPIYTPGISFNNPIKDFEVKKVDLIKCLK
jgi:predicted acylesterase/phospholipase RssA